ncbi:MAG: hypothetical protein M0Z53_02575 [Thermaerobacter sp.]|nr:hypothetical protein [Thermaerobacter sp.]
MAGAWRQVTVSGVAATILSGLVLQVAAMAGLPAPNLALWAGTLITLHLGTATAVGYVLELLAGVGLARLYLALIRHRRRSTVLRGMAYGLLLWALVMTIGLPLFGRVSPLVGNGLLLDPGFFSLQFGPSAPVIWLVTLEMFGASLGLLMGDAITRWPPG